MALYSECRSKPVTVLLRRDVAQSDHRHCAPRNFLAGKIFCLANKGVDGRIDRKNKLIGSANILTGFCIDLDVISLVNEERYMNHQS